MMKGQVYQLKPCVLPSNTIGLRVKPRVKAVRINGRFCCAFKEELLKDVRMERYGRHSPRVKLRVEAVGMNVRFCRVAKQDRTADVGGGTFGE